ncbi:uncharacterized protein LACBIDRAFT_329693 [Laccaria bicolor S238N-H82]|uniref:acetate--CoA ligase n=1 Tax=Laccaria bicolor (strain S238N-H82 / ATCC MYA-4686) TaxID=486041 RepID=B0DIW2_LACBS|nr:uncharacterized protein LACBIDRAFT_329693 [Laccaria bicolor S238N-H82]EDR05414.1 predicted protein [Laccaria bicolor S238N-H82]|eukprot:XP_001883972.1 predicted protein [Laccaria bicolor S238N-H82]
MADVGWITGHTYVIFSSITRNSQMTSRYIVYGPLANGVTTTVLTTSRTTTSAACASLAAWASLSTQRRRIGIIYNEHVGKTQCAIVDTFWQTETGSIIVTPFPGAIETLPGSATIPFFGIEPAILDPVTGNELEGNNVEGVLVLKTPWPSIARTVCKEHKSYLGTCMNCLPDSTVSWKLKYVAYYILQVRSRSWGNMRKVRRK